MDLVQRLNQHHPKVIDLSLERIERLLGVLGHPENNLPPVIHIAGTNGKGSSLAFMRAITEAAGLRVHVYTSPHLVAFNERIRICGELISDAAMLALIEEVEAANRDAAITFFEITTAIALLAFSRTPADLVLLETGLGGRLDATNVIARPAVTALTPISQDHAGFLGDDLAGIAVEKAAIMKPGVPCVTTKQDKAVLDVIRGFAAGVDAPLIVEEEDWWIAIKGDQLTVMTPEGEVEPPLPTLPGPHQLQNAGLAIVALAALGDVRITREAVAKGMTSVDWPARMQQLTAGPLADQLPTDWELWLDGGHNPAAGEVLAATIKTFDDKPLFLITGLINSKDPGGFLSPLKDHTTAICTVEIAGEEASLSAEELSTTAKEIGFAASGATTIEDALSQIIGQTKSPSRILICGSLYLAGSVLKENS
ncbi:MAG: bifunctional folylpolyglutamate synthase/dihydrofolate synthase [Rhodospirillaceae bacterium]|jgi:dihydrofolate synthase / folylpolyglutamate synthase|nr:bifunctional folylpolyglutamate synthase/dihydrofolate synthase [Rhodospirillaceae bacterium]